MTRSPFDSVVPIHSGGQRIDRRTPQRRRQGSFSNTVQALGMLMAGLWACLQDPAIDLFVLILFLWRLFNP
jgi:hypothetical protein